MRRIFAILLSIAVLIPASAYGLTREITSSQVKPIALKEKNIDLRIISLANGAAEILSSLGYKSAIVGRDIASTTPELKAVPIVTSGHQVIAEKVISLKPNLVIIDVSTGPKSALEMIEKAGIKVVSVKEAWNLEDMFGKVAMVGAAIGKEKDAAELSKKMKREVSQAHLTLGWRPKVLFLYLRGPSSIYLIGGKGSGADSLLSAMGAVDVGAKMNAKPFNALTGEALLSANPDVILLMTKGLQSVGGISGLLKLPGISNTIAGKNQNILAVDDSLLLSFGPRTPALLRQMAIALKDMK